MEETCPHCSRNLQGKSPLESRAEALLREHRTHLQAKALAEGGYVEARFGSYGCDSGCEYTRYEVYNGRGEHVATEGDFGEPDEVLLRQWADYYGVRVFGA